MAKKVLIKNGKAFIDEKGDILSLNFVDNSGTPIEISTVEQMENKLISENVGKIYKYLGETNENFENGEFYQVVEE